MRTYYIYLLLFLFIGLPYSSSAQNFLVGVSSGYKLNLSNQEGYTKAGSVPLNFRVGGGFRVFQAGVEYNYQILKPTYIFYDQFLPGNIERFREEYKEHDFTGFLRLSTQKQSDGHAFFFVTNFGATFSNKDVSRPDIGNFSNISYKPSLLFKSAIGGSFALASPLHLDIEVQYGYSFGRQEKVNSDIEDVVTTKFSAHGIGVHIGLSYTFLP